MVHTDRKALFLRGILVLHLTAFSQGLDFAIP
jgi:hypothetical protein